MNPQDRNNLKDIFATLGKLESARRWALSHGELDADLPGLVLGGDFAGSLHLGLPGGFVHYQSKPCFQADALVDEPGTSPGRASVWRSPRCVDSLGANFPGIHFLGESKPRSGDPLGLQLSLKLAIQFDQPFALAVALGRCRLYDISIPAGLDFSLSAEAFVPIVDSMCQQIMSRLTMARAGLPNAMDESGSLYLRMDVWAAMVAMDESYAGALFEGGPDVKSMNRKLNQGQRLVELLDNHLTQNKPEKRTAASDRLLRNWRRLLAPNHQRCLPWWLQ